MLWRICQVITELKLADFTIFNHYLTYCSMQIYALQEEAGVPGEGPCRLEGSNLEPSCCEVTVLTTMLAVRRDNG